MPDGKCVAQCRPTPFELEGSPAAAKIDATASIRLLFIGSLCDMTDARIEVLSGLTI
jgi:hypothetical protein